MIIHSIIIVPIFVVIVTTMMVNNNQLFQAICFTQQLPILTKRILNRFGNNNIQCALTVTDQ